MTTTTDPDSGVLTPAEMAERTGVSIDTLRYYEREGLLANVTRADSGHRRYSVNDVLWVKILRCLRNTGMTIEQLRDYCELGEQGDHTQPARLQLFLDHRALIESQIDELRAALELLDHKIDFYRTAIEGGTP